MNLPTAKRLRVLWFATVGLGAFSVFAFFTSPAALVYLISNKRVKWEGTIAGLVPRVTGQAERLVWLRGRDCTPYLVHALDDDTRYVAAHVLLSHLFEEDFPQGVQLGSEAWHSLEVVLYGDGRTEMPAGQKAKLKQLWDERLNGA